MKKLTAILFFCFCLWVSALGQELNGIWKGTLTQQPGGCFPVYYIELQIHIEGEKMDAGVSYHYYNLANYVKKKFSGTYDAALRKITVKELNILTFHIPVDCTPCIKDYELWYSKNGSKETLSGEWTGKVLNTNEQCQPGQIVLTRVNESAFKEIPEIAVDTGQIRLDFYDNATIDDDSISVFVNKKLVLSNQRLSLKPITTYVTIDLQNTFQEVEMVAQNLGSIPPNTALLMVTAGTKRYRLYLTSTETKSAMVRFIYDPPVH